MEHKFKELRQSANIAAIPVAKGFSGIYDCPATQFLPFPTELDPLLKFKLTLFKKTACLFVAELQGGNVPVWVQASLANSKMGNMLEAITEVAEG